MIRWNEIWEVVRNFNGSLDFVPAFPLVVEAEGTLDSYARAALDKIVWRRELPSVKGRTTSKDAANISSRARASYNTIVKIQDITLPLLSYYGTGRRLEEPRGASFLRGSAGLNRAEATVGT